MVASAASTAGGGNPPFRIRGTLTITRAASIQREIDAEADPLVIDLSGVERMDTVGAWLVYRAVRDRGAKVALLDLDKQCSSSIWLAQVEPKITVRTAATPEECLSELELQSLRLRRYAPRPVAGGVGDPRGPPSGPRRR